MLRKEINNRLAAANGVLDRNSFVEGSHVINDFEDNDGNSFPDILEVLFNSETDKEEVLKTILSLNEMDITVVDVQREVEWDNDESTLVEYRDIYYCKVL